MGPSPVTVHQEAEILTGTRNLPRAEVRGKFLFAGGEKIYLRGVTYGTFRPDESGCQFPAPPVVARDFQMMVECGINAVRTYTVPPLWLLDLASQAGLYVMAGIPWEQHVTFLDEGKRRRRIVRDVRRGVRSCASHPAVLAYVIGNEIPAPIVRWYGRKRVERFLKQLYSAARHEDEFALITYVNYPTTEYLDLSFTDFVSFNVYLESPERLRSYLARLQNLAGDKPLVMAEMGLDSRRHGAQQQADVLRWQIREAFAEGCAGAFVFAWTDEWYRGGYDIEDWDFGLTDRARNAKPALRAVKDAFHEVPFAREISWPSVSVVICSYNGARTITDTFQALQHLDYPDFEVILVDDGSTDMTAAIGREYGAVVISTENRGLSNARNTGFEAATGEIVAYIDDDAYPDLQWLKYLAHRFLNEPFVGVGGPNFPPHGDGLIAECVAGSPGGPVHVLLSDTEAEHIPGCNMAFRKHSLAEVGGCDPIYRAAGDDVDLCWRLIDAGGKIGFHASAVVWHHRRNSVKTYFKQQRGYGRAEALLERKWPQKYNPPGHLTWAGRLYGNGMTVALFRASARLYQGHAGTAPFQSVYEPRAGLLASLPLMPEWYAVIVCLGAVTALGALWWPLLLAGPLLLLAAVAPVGQAAASAARASLAARHGVVTRCKMRVLIGVLHLVQPFGRLYGRLEYGLSPWRIRGRGLVLPIPRRLDSWSESWRSLDDRASAMAHCLLQEQASWSPGGDYDAWDFEVRGGLFGSARTTSMVEDHEGGRQMVRTRSWPRASASGVAVSAVFAMLALAGGLSGAWVVSGILGLAALILLMRLMWECARSMGIIAAAVTARGRLTE